MKMQRLLLGIFVASLIPAAASAADTIKIGYPMPLSGPASVYGVPVVKGAEMAVAEINASGGVLGRKLELLTRDSKASADEAVNPGEWRTLRCTIMFSEVRVRCLNVHCATPKVQI